MRYSILSLVILLPVSSLPAEVCFVPSSNGWNASVDCDQVAPQPWDNNHRGYRTDGEPCAFPEFGPCSVVGGYGFDENYGWSISSSSTFPEESTGPLPEGTTSLYLWVACTRSVGGNNLGIAAAEFGLAVDDPSLALIDLTPLPFVLNAGTPQEPRLAIGGCPVGPVLVATLTLSHLPVPVEGSSWGSLKALYR